MQIKVAEEVQAGAVEMEGAAGVTMRMLIGPADGAPRFNMRMFDVAPGGHTPSHTHAWEHEVYVLSGQGRVHTPDGDVEIAAGRCLLVPPGERHQFVNTGGGVLRFLCLVPRESG